jgi:hypothetical protein
MALSAGVEINVSDGDGAAAKDSIQKETREIYKEIELLYVKGSNAAQYSEGEEKIWVWYEDTS